jgi:drug/metabolite transporter (DMT)-like permease
MATPRIPKFLTLIGLALVVAGIAFKLNHLMGAEQVFNAGAIVLVAGLVSWATAVVRQKKQ